MNETDSLTKVMNSIGTGIAHLFIGRQRLLYQAGIVDRNLAPVINSAKLGGTRMLKMRGPIPLHIATFLLAIGAISLGSCCNLSFRRLPDPPPAAPRVAVNGPWQPWDRQLTGTGQSFSVGGRPYFVVNVAPSAQPPQCRIVTYDRGSNAWLASAFPRCFGIDGLVPEAPPDAGVRTAAIWMNDVALMTTDGGSTWRPTQPIVPGSVAAVYQPSAAADGKGQPVSWTVMTARGSASPAGYSSGSSGTWSRHYEWGLFGAFPLTSPRLIRSPSKAVIWRSNQSAYVYVPQQMLNKWQRIGLEAANEILLRLAFAPGSDDLVVQLRETVANTTSLCRFTPLNNAPYWQRHSCGALPGLTTPIFYLRYFTATRFLATAQRELLLTSDSGATFSNVLTLPAGEMIGGLATYTATDAVAVVRSTAGYRLIASDDGGATWRNL